MSGILRQREVRGSGVINRDVTYTQAEITGLGTVTSGTISTGAVIDDPTMTQGSDATGDVYYRAASGKLTRLATGADGTVLTSTGAGAVPAFEAAAAGGKILQVTGQTTGTTFTTMTTAAGPGTVNATVVTAAVTPTASDSDIVIMCKHMVMVTNSTLDYGYSLYWQRAISGGATTYPAALDEGDGTVYGASGYGSVGDGINEIFPHQHCKIDSPATTSAVTYTLYCKTYHIDATNTIGGVMQGKWSIWFMEIAR